MPRCIISRYLTSAIRLVCWVVFIVNLDAFVHGRLHGSSVFDVGQGCLDARQARRPAAAAPSSGSPPRSPSRPAPRALSPAVAAAPAPASAPCPR
ncbi:hypothetical protein VTK73DRAFT_6344 [Phialemonium thermophilum]|uniref:Uncharacterized protein n=1 Tax=Phialemonium thermophilum TaxID=223376 RepID=A0ABR3UZV9_9PEZI